MLFLFEPPFPPEGSALPPGAALPEGAAARRRRSFADHFLNSKFKLARSLGEETLSEGVSFRTPGREWGELHLILGLSR